MIQNEQKHGVVILTALQVEYEAVRAFLTNLHHMINLGTIYERGTFSAQGQGWDVAIVMVGPGSASAAFETERAINYFTPDIVLFVGIAGGLKDVGIGDVVVATKVYSYAPTTANTKFLPRPEVAITRHSLLQIAKIEAKKKDWLYCLKQVEHSLPLTPPHIHVAPVATAEEVVASSSDLYHFLRSVYGDAVAVEMEGYGFLQVVHANRSVDALIIRGIAELIDDKQSKSDKQNRQMAARHASAFAFQLLANLAARYENQSASLSQSPQSIAPQLMAPDPTYTMEIFYVYADQDEKYAQVLQKQLALLKRRGLITDWHGGRITTSGDYSELIHYLNSAQIILLLISPYFVSSEYLDEIATRAMERRVENATVVIPIILRPTDWEATSIGTLQSLPRGGKPLNKFSDLDMAFQVIADELRSVIEALKVTRPQ